MEHVDTLVIGAGVIGLSVARELSMAGHDVVVAEAAGAIGTGMSARNSEVVHAGIYYPRGSLKANRCSVGDVQISWAEPPGVQSIGPIAEAGIGWPSVGFGRRRPFTTM